MPTDTLAWLRTVVYITASYVLINGSSATLFDQVNAWDDFHGVEHGALVVPAGRAKFLDGLLFV